jgi:hypothetical protein
MSAHLVRRYARAVNQGGGGYYFYHVMTHIGVPEMTMENNLIGHLWLGTFCSPLWWQRPLAFAVWTWRSRTVEVVKEAHPSYRGDLTSKSHFQRAVPRG